jgi:hypothetical protein
MKKETAAQKLMALLGQVNDEVKDRLEEVAKHTKAKQGNIKSITEEEIQNFREAQGVLYFLQAPALFQPKVCKHCGEHFLVSRLYVAYCSYTCIRKELNSQGLEWRKGRDLEALINDPQVYNGNEPIWIRNLPNLKKCLEMLQSMNLDEQDSTLSSPSTSSEEKSTSSNLIRL